MKIQQLKLESITRYDKNPRDNDKAVESVARSIEEFGFQQPLVVDRFFVIVAGDTRYLAAKRLGLKTVPVHVAQELTPKQIRAYRLADNRLGEIATWDKELLQVELSALQEADCDLSLLGFGESELAALIGQASASGVDPDDIPEPPDSATTRPGDLWILGPHRLLCGDSAKAADVDRLLDGARAHLVNTDPPYNVKVEPRSNNAIASSKRRKHHQKFDLKRHPEKAKPTSRKLRPKDRALANDFISDAEFDQLLRSWFANMARVLAPGGAFYAWGGYANLANYPPALAAAGLYFSQAVVWIKEHPVLTRKDFMGNFELCFYGWREGAAHSFHGPRNIADVWRVSRSGATGVALGAGVRLEASDGSRLDVLPPGKGDPQTLRLPADGINVYGPGDATDVWSVRKVSSHHMVHLTEKPVELAARAMRYSSQRGENVLDLFGGSGSTLAAAELNERRAFLMELDPLYADVIVQRWENLSGKRAKLQRGKRRCAT